MSVYVYFLEMFILLFFVLDEVLNTKSKNVEKNISDLSQLIMEKLKFLSDGKGSVAPVQVMAIQIEVIRILF